MSQSQQDHQSKNEVMPAGMAGPEVILWPIMRSYKLKELNNERIE
jgi:hypothetical protein